MNDERPFVLSRVTVALAVVAYVVVFLVSIGEGTEAEVALLKAMTAMLALGVVGLIGIAIVKDTPAEEGSAADQGPLPRRLDVSLAAVPEEMAATVAGGGAGKRIGETR